MRLNGPYINFLAAAVSIAVAGALGWEFVVKPVAVWMGWKL